MERGIDWRFVWKGALLEFWWEGENGVLLCCLWAGHMSDIERQSFQIVNGESLET